MRLGTLRHRHPPGFSRENSLRSDGGIGRMVDGEDGGCPWRTPEMRNSPFRNISRNKTEPNEEITFIHRAVHHRGEQQDHHCDCHRAEYEPERQNTARNCRTGLRLPEGARKNRLSMFLLDMSMPFPSMLQLHLNCCFTVASNVSRDEQGEGCQKCIDLVTNQSLLYVIGPLTSENTLAMMKPWSCQQHSSISTCPRTICLTMAKMN